MVKPVIVTSPKKLTSTFSVWMAALKSLFKNYINLIIIIIVLIKIDIMFHVKHYIINYPLKLYTIITI